MAKDRDKRETERPTAVEIDATALRKMARNNRFLADQTEEVLESRDALERSILRKFLAGYRSNADVLEAIAANIEARP